MKDDITLVRNDEGDWIGLYKNGGLVYENHSIESSHLLDLVGVEYSLIMDVDVEPFGNRLPDRLYELVAALESK